MLVAFFLFGLVENFLIPKNDSWAAMYLFFVVLYMIQEDYTQTVIKLLYKLVGIYTESNFFEFQSLNEDGIDRMTIEELKAKTVTQPLKFGKNNRSVLVSRMAAHREEELRILREFRKKMYYQKLEKAQQYVNQSGEDEFERSSSASLTLVQGHSVTDSVPNEKANLLPSKFSMRTLTSKFKKSNSIREVKFINTPRNWVERILFFAYFPFLFLLHHALPSRNIRSLKQLFFGLSGTILLLIGLTFLLYFLTMSISISEIIPPGVETLAFGLTQMSYLLYAISSNSNSGKFWHVTFQEMFVWDFSMLFIIRFVINVLTDIELKSLAWSEVGLLHLHFLLANLYFMGVCLLQNQQVKPILHSPLFLGFAVHFVLLWMI